MDGTIQLASSQGSKQNRRSSRVPAKCSPHLGNVTTFALGFTLVSALKSICPGTVRAKFVHIDSDTAPGQETHFKRRLMPQESQTYQGFWSHLDWEDDVQPDATESLWTQVAAVLMVLCA
jgi:hypothetical protein